MQFHHFFPRYPGEFHGIKVLIRVYDINHVMQDTVLLLGRRLGGSDVHTTIDLHRIRADNLTTEPFGNLDGDRGFADSGRTADDDDFGFG